ncbi:MAG: hypothetical protein M0Q21_09780 [Ignavibacteriaceae bacterium]|nr:hypothetical protein [Ignavibacteriaceae bacterium]
MKKETIFSLCLIFFSTLWLQGQTTRSSYEVSNSAFLIDSFQINFDNQYRIKSTNIIPGTENILLKGKKLSAHDYKINYALGMISLSDSLPYSIFDTIFVAYRSVKISLQKEYQRRELVVRYDESRKDTMRVLRLNKPIDAESVFGNSIEKSGSIIRGFTVGTNKDLTLQSGLRLQLAGKLSDDIEVIAALTDENTPIQPEGNTERLDELDKVFIQLKHKNAAATFGDYEVQKRYGEFGVVNRKLQGLLGEFQFGNTEGYVALANAKGKFNSNSFNGQDGVQGPYRLSGQNNERDIIIIAGSEKVFVNGEEMKRGERSDYTIDYSNSQIIFTPQRLITAASRIAIDFEYTDRRYVRNFFATGTSTQLYSNKIKIAFQYMREGDDQNSPIDISLGDADKMILENAGDRKDLAIKSGVSLATIDSTGQLKGVYEKKDSLINDQIYSVYLYNPGSDSALYNVSFSYVGEYQGDYFRESLGQYRYVGKNSGAYLPVIYLPLPELKQFGNLFFQYNPTKDIFLQVEFAGSSWDKNRFSSLDEKDNFGLARNLSFKMNPLKIQLGGINFGKIGLSLRERFIQDRFTSLERFDKVEFTRDYNSSSSSQGNEKLREGSLLLQPIENMRSTFSYGSLKRGDAFSSDRFMNQTDLTKEKEYQFQYQIDFVNTKNGSLGSSWLRQKGTSFYSFGMIKPGFDFTAEKKLEKISQADSLLSSSLQYFEGNPGIQITKFYGIDASIKYLFRTDYYPLAGILQKESNSYGEIYELSYAGRKEISSQLRITVQNKKYTDAYKMKGQLDNQTILVRSQTRFSTTENAANGDVYYEVQTQKTAKLQKVFVKVEKGNGNYIYLGDLNYNGIAEENEFLPVVYDGEFIVVNVPTDQLFPVIDLKTSARLKLNYENIYSSNNFIGAVVKALSSETYGRIEENSQETDLKKIYLLKLSSYLNEKNTIRGSQYFQQDFFVFENSAELSFRLRYSQRRSLNQFSGGAEKGFSKERSLRIKFKLLQEIGNQTDLENKIDNLFAGLSSNRSRAIETNGITTDFSYRPERNIEVGLKIKSAKSTDYFPKKSTEIFTNGQAVRINISFSGYGRLRLEIERNELTTNTVENYLPFELTAGNVVGKNYFWRLFFDYRFGTNLLSTANYDGRKLGGGKIIHTARVEVRAFF